MHKKLIQVILSLLLIINFSYLVCAKTVTAGASYSHTSSSLASAKKDLLKYLSNNIKGAARDATAAQPLTICSGAAVIISGDSTSPGDTYLWQIQQSDGTWAAAPVPSSSGRFNTDANFFAAGLTNNSTTNTNVLYHLRRQVTNSGSTTYDSFYDVTVQPSNPLSNNNITAPAITSFCTSGTVATITGTAATGGSGGISYQWQSSTDGGNTYTPISGANTQSFTPGNITTTTYYQRVASSNSCVAPTTSNTVIITVLPAVTNYDVNAPAVIDFCASGDPATIVGNTPAGGTGTYVYQWQSSTDGSTFTNISGATSKDYDPSTLTSTTYYRRIVSSGACSGPYISSTVKITINPPVLNNTVTTPAVITFCASGTPGTITGSTPTGGSGTYTYQWQSSADGSTFTNIAGATGKDYPVPVISTTTYYRRLVTGIGCQLPAPSSSVKITIQQAITNNNISAPAVTTFCGSGTPATITGNVPSGGSGAYAFQWQMSTDGTNFTDITGETGQNYTPSAPISTTTYYRRNVISGACSTPESSTAVIITIQQAIANNTISPPAQVQFCGPGTPGAITGSLPTGGNGTYTYQWQSSADSITFTNIAGANGQNYTPPATLGKIYYRRTVTSGSCSTPQATAAIAITIQSVIDNNNITAPAQTTFCGPGTPAAINGTVPTGGSGTYTYQWQSSADGTNFTNIAGATGQNYTPSGPVATSTYYRRLVTSGVCTAPQPSTAVLITIQQAIANNTITPPAQVNFCGPGTPGQITGSLPTGGSGTYTYQWQSSTDNVTFTDIAGANGQSYTPPATTGTFYYRRTVTSGACSTPQVTAAVTITIQSVIANNNITAPAQTTFCGSGTPGTITGSAPTGGSGTYTYQWQSSADGTNFTNITGATGQSYTPSSPVTTNTYFRRLVTSGVCTTPQPTAAILITIEQAIANNSITAPAQVNFCGPATPDAIKGSLPTGGSGTYTYQWQSSTDNTTFTNIAGATNQDYTPPATVGTFYYRRVVTSGSCSTPQSTASVSITIQSIITNNTITAPAVTTFCGPGAPGTFTGSTPSGGSGTYAYQWQSSTDGTNFTDIPGATGPSYTPVSVSTTTYFRRTVTSGVCTTPQPTAAILITIQQAIANNAITPPAQVNFCGPGTPGAITGSLPTGGDGTYSYQWQSSPDNIVFTDIAGATGKDYTPPATMGTFYYRRRVSSGSCATPQTTTSVSISIQPVLSNNVLAAPAVTTFCGPGTPGTINGSLPSGGSGIYTYQWQSSTDGTNFTDIPNATGQNYTPSVAISITTYFRRTVTSGNCQTPLPSTNAVVITITTDITNNSITPPAITNFCGTAIPPGTITGSTPTGGDNTFAYQWQSSTDGTNFTNIAGATGKDYTPPATLGSIYYRRTVISGPCSTPKATTAILITIQAAITNNSLTAPGTITFCGPAVPSTIIGSAPAGGSGAFTYQWQSSADGTTFTDIPNATNKDYTPSTVSTTTTYRRIVISGNCQTPSISANTVTITINPPLSNNNITAPAVTAFCVTGNPAAITGSVPQGGSGTYTYQWQSSTDNASFTDISGATSPDYTPSAVTVTTYYRRVVTSGACTTPFPSGSIVITITPLPPVPVPAATTVANCFGASASLSVTAPQSGITYNWYDSPAKTNLLFTGSVYVTQQLTTNTTFYVESSNGVCTNPTLGSVQVNIVPLPATPAVVNNSVSTCNSTSAVLSVDSPQPGITYNWYQSATGGTSVFTGVTFTTPALTATTTYYVEAVSASGCPSPSRAAVVVTVQPLPQVTAQGTSVCPGSTATLTATSDVAGATLNWYTDALGGTPVFTGSTFTTPALNSNTAYYVEAVNNSTGCISNRQSVQVNMIQPLPAPVVSVATSTMSSVTFKWNAVSGATGYLVSIDNGTTFVNPSSGSNGLTHTVTGLPENQLVTIIVKAIGNAPCEVSADSKAVTGQALNLTDDIFVPNAFTPNGDGKNDILYVYSEGIKTVINFSVYDQWGELLFVSTNKESGWDGTYKGTKEPVGVYVYYLKAIMNNGHEVNKKGTITLLR